VSGLVGRNTHGKWLFEKIEYWVKALIGKVPTGHTIVWKKISRKCKEQCVPIPKNVQGRLIAHWEIHAKTNDIIIIAEKCW
jgi:hypothetical protein